jgi:hypothetical protein
MSFVQDFSGVQLRVMSVEGPLMCVRRAHYHLQELFVDPVQLSSSLQPSGTGNVYGSSYGDMSGLPPSSPYGMSLTPTHAGKQCK